MRWSFEPVMTWLVFCGADMVITLPLWPVNLPITANLEYDASVRLKLALAEQHVLPATAQAVSNIRDVRNLCYCLKCMSV